MKKRNEEDRQLEKEKENTIYKYAQNSTPDARYMLKETKIETISMCEIHSDCNDCDIADFTKRCHEQTCYCCNADKNAGVRNKTR
jgi:hypothetical protein